SKPDGGPLWPVAMMRCRVSTMTAPTWARTHSERAETASATWDHTSSHDGRDCIAVPTEPVTRFLLARVLFEQSGIASEQHVRDLLGNRVRTAHETRGLVLVLRGDTYAVDLFKIMFIQMQ